MPPDIDGWQNCQTSMSRSRRDLAQAMGMQMHFHSYHDTTKNCVLKKLQQTQEMGLLMASLPRSWDISPEPLLLMQETINQAILHMIRQLPHLLILTYWMPSCKTQLYDVCSSLNNKVESHESMSKGWNYWVLRSCYVNGIGCTWQHPEYCNIIQPVNLHYQQSTVP